MRATHEGPRPFSQAADTAPDPAVGPHRRPGWLGGKTCVHPPESAKSLISPQFNSDSRRKKETCPGGPCTLPVRCLRHVPALPRHVRPWGPCPQVCRLAREAARSCSDMHVHPDSTRAHDAPGVCRVRGAVLDTLAKAVGSAGCSLPSRTSQLGGWRLIARLRTEANPRGDRGPGPDLSLPSGSGGSAGPPCGNLSTPHGPQTDEGGSTAARA